MPTSPSTKTASAPVDPNNKTTYIYTRFRTRGGQEALVNAHLGLPIPWQRFGFLVHPGVGYEPCLWTHEGNYREDRTPHPCDLQANLGEVTISGPVVLHL